MYARNSLPPLIALFLTGCATQLTLISPPIPNELVSRCTITVDPLTSGDQYDVARALAQSQKGYRECKAKHDALINAIETREQVIQSIKNQMSSKK